MAALIIRIPDGKHAEYDRINPVAQGFASGGWFSVFLQPLHERGRGLDRIALP